MKAVLVALLLFGMAVPALAQEENPCDGLDLQAGEVCLSYEGYPIGVQEDGPTLQPIVIRVTDGLRGVESCEGILVVRTRDGWAVADTLFYEDRGELDCEVGDETFDVTGKR
jgi:hypothetical protein